MFANQEKAGMATKTERRESLKVIVDSNAFFIPMRFKIDIFVELEHLLNRRFDLILLSPVKHELETLATKGSSKTRRDAAFASQLAEKCMLVDVDPGPVRDVDDVIVKTAAEWKAVVFTNDEHLRDRLRDISVPVIYLRQKSRLEIDGLI
jgi:rRNA-processing protein FCF1